MRGVRAVHGAGGLVLVQSEESAKFDGMPRSAIETGLADLVAPPEGIGRTLMDQAARVIGGQGEFAIITASLTAANMIEWQKCIEERRQEKYPQIKMAALRPCDDLQKKALDDGLLVRALPYADVVSFSPPLSITAAEIDEVVERFARAFERAIPELRDAAAR